MPDIKLTNEDLLGQATCAIFLDGKIKGTGWLFSEEGHLLTAGHILGVKNPSNTVDVQFKGDFPVKAHKIHWGFQPEMGIDFAILKMEKLSSSIIPLPISIERSINGKFKGCGYGVSLKHQSIGSGDYIGFFDVQNSPSNRLYLLRSSELGESGYSGSPIFSEELNAVIGIQVESTMANVGAGRDTVLAMPLYRISQLWDPLRSFTQILDPQQIFTPNLTSNLLQCSYLGFAGTYNFVNSGDEFTKSFEFVKLLVRQGAVFLDTEDNSFIKINVSEIEAYFENNKQVEWLGRLVIEPSCLFVIMKEFVGNLDKTQDFSKNLYNWFKTLELYPSLWVCLDFPGQTSYGTVIISYLHYKPSFIPKEFEDKNNTDEMYSIDKAANILVKDIYGDIDNLFSAFVFGSGEFIYPQQELRKLSFVYFIRVHSSIDSLDLLKLSPLFKRVLLVSSIKDIASTRILSEYNLFYARGFIGMTGQPKTSKTPSLQLIISSNRKTKNDHELLDILRSLSQLEKVGANLNTINEYYIPAIEDAIEKTLARMREIFGEARHFSTDKDIYFSKSDVMTLVKRGTILDDNLKENIVSLFQVRTYLSDFLHSTISFENFLHSKEHELEIETKEGDEDFNFIRSTLCRNLVHSLSSCERKLLTKYDLFNQTYILTSKSRLSLYGKYSSLLDFDFISGDSEIETCFVLMPFRKEFDDIYEEIILPIFKENNWGIECYRADDIYSTNFIVQDIWLAIRKAKFIIAELTYRNPNVLYELGLCHVLRKPVVLTTQSIEDIPFDLRHLRCIEYELGPKGLKKLKFSLKNTIDALLKENFKGTDIFQD